MNLLYRRLLMASLFLLLPAPSLAATNLDDVSVALTPPGSPDYFADNVSRVGDLNNDGKDDIVLSSQNYGAQERGALYVMYGRNKKFTDGEVVAKKITGRLHEGIAVTSADGGCDLNGDGFDDVLVTTQNYNGDTLEYVRTDRLYIMYGRSKKFATGRITTHDYIDLADNISVAVACNGDANGDGYDDIVLSDLFYDTDSTANVGQVKLIFGQSSHLTTADYAAATTWDAPTDTGTSFGYAVGYAGDVNSDSFADILLSQVGNNEQVDHGGKVYLVYGSAGIATANALAGAVEWFSTTEDLYLGTMVSSAGDLNADGFDDVVFSSTWYDTDAASNAGVLYVYYGKSGRLSGGDVADNTASIAGTSYHNYIGNANSVSFGRVNSDQYSDLVFNSFIHSDTEHYGGEIYIQYGKSQHITTTLTSALLKYYRIEHVTDGIDRIYDLTVADLNDNGKDDIIVVNTNISQVQIKYN